MPTNPHRGKLRRPAHTKTRQLTLERLMLNLEHLKSEEEMEYHVQALVPEAWDTLEQDVDVDEPKVKTTLYLDQSVAKFFKAMGKGYHARVNRILATFAQMRIVQIRRMEDMLDEELAKIATLRGDAPQEEPAEETEPTEETGRSKEEFWENLDGELGEVWRKLRES